MASYEELIKDDQFIRDSYASLKALGEKPEKFTTRKQIVDEILKEQRYFQNNAIAAADVARDIDKMDASTRNAFSRSLNQLDQMPSFFQKGGSSFWSGMVDHTLSTLSDPINLAGAFAGAATLGAGTAASIASRATARQSTKNYLKNKLKTALTDPNVRKAAALEAGITGTGGFGRSAYTQGQIDVELGRQEKIDFARAAVDGLIEGPTSILLGAGISTGAGALFRSADNVLDKQFQKVSKEGEFKGHRYEWLKSFLMPPSARDEVSLRLLEEQKNNVKGFETEARSIGDELEANIKNAYDNVEDGTLEVNLVLAGKKSFESLGNEKVQESVSKAIKLIKDTQEEAFKTPGLRNKFRAMFHQFASNDPEGSNYARDIFEIFAVSRRETKFEDFIKGNEDIYEDIAKFIEEEPNWFKEVLDETTRKTLAKKGIDETSFTGTNRLQAAKELAKLEYQPKKGRFRNDAVTNKKLTQEVLPEWQKKIWGVNYSPSLRIVESVSGILSTVDSIKFAGDLSQSFVSRGLAVKAPAKVTRVNGQKVVSEKSTKERVKDAFLERNAQDIANAERKLAILSRFDSLSGSQQEAVLNTLGGKSVQNRITELDIELNGLRNESIELKSLDAETDFVPVIGNTKSKNYKDSLIQTDGRRHNSTAKNFFITRRTYAKYKPLMRDYNDLQEGVASLFSGAARTGIQGIAKVQGTLKIGKTVFSPLGHLRNILGAFQATMGAGNTFRSVQALKQYYDMAPEERTQALLTAEKAGVMRSSVDLEQALTRLGRDINEKPGVIETLGTFGLARTGIGRAAMKFYGATDDVAKFITFNSERNRLKALWNDPNADPAWKLRKANELADAYNQRGEKKNPFVKDKSKENFLARLEEQGVEVSDEVQERLFAPFRERERFFSRASDGKAKRTLDYVKTDDVINELAAQKTLNIMPVYTRVPPVLEALAGLPVIGNFTAYQTEVFRNAYKIYTTAAQEVYEGFSLGPTSSTGRKLIASGINRQNSLAAMAMAPYALAQYHNEAEGTESTIESLRSFVPPWHKYGALILESVDPTGGKIKYLDMGYTNPYQPIVATLAPLMAGIANGEDLETLIFENGKQAVRTFIDPYVDQSLASQAATSFYDIITGQGDIKRNAKNLFNATLPGVIKQGLDVGWKLGELPQAVEELMYPTAFGGSKRRNEPRSFSELGSILKEQGYFVPPGLKTFELDLTTQTGYAIKTATQAYREDYTDISRKLKRDLTGIRPIRNAETILSDYTDTMETQYIAQQALSEIYTDLSNIIGKRKARKMLLGKDLENATPAKKALYSILRESPRSRLTTLSNNKIFWRSIARTPAGRQRNLSGWRQALRSIERKYNLKDLRKDPVED